MPALCRALYPVILVSAWPGFLANILAGTYCRLPVYAMFIQYTLINTASGILYVHTVEEAKANVVAPFWGTALL